MVDESHDDWDDVWEQRTAGLEQLLGKPDDLVYHAIVPLQLGGSCDVLSFRKHVPGLTYVTSDLTGIGQSANRLGTYELMICTREESDWAINIISRLGTYTLEAIINPGETMDIDSAVPDGSTISAFLFTEPDLTENAFAVGDETASLLLCIGITPAELEMCHKEGADKMIERLRNASVFPFTDLNRKSVC